MVPLSQEQGQYNFIIISPHFIIQLKGLATLFHSLKRQLGNNFFFPRGYVRMVTRVRASLWLDDDHSMKSVAAPLCKLI